MDKVISALVMMLILVGFIVQSFSGPEFVQSPDGARYQGKMKDGLMHGAAPGA